MTMPGNISMEELSNQFSQDRLKCLPIPKDVRCVEGCFRGDDIVQWLEKQVIRVEHIGGSSLIFDKSVGFWSEL